MALFEQPQPQKCCPCPSYNDREYVAIEKKGVKKRGKARVVSKSHYSNFEAPKLSRCSVLRSCEYFRPIFLNGRGIIILFLRERKPVLGKDVVFALSFLLMHPTHF